MAVECQMGVEGDAEEFDLALFIDGCATKADWRHSPCRPVMVDDEGL